MYYTTSEFYYLYVNKIINLMIAYINYQNFPMKTYG